MWEWLTRLQDIHIVEYCVTDQKKKKKNEVLSLQMIWRDFQVLISFMMGFLLLLMHR